MENKKDYWKEKEAHYIWWCCAKVKQAKTREEVYRLKCIWCNHVNARHDWLFSNCIPKELK